MSAVSLIRHGQSVSNAGGQTGDPAMIPLSPTGERQAELVAQVFDHPPDLVVTSPFLRARQTAQPTIDRFPGVPVQEWPIEEFTYLGSLHGRPTTGAQRKPFVDAYWDTADPHYVDDDKSESFADVLNRANQFLSRMTDRMAHSKVDHIAAFTHGLFMRVVLWSILTDEVPSPEAMRRFYKFRTTYLIPNCSIITLRLDSPPHIIGATMTHLPQPLHTGE